MCTLFSSGLIELFKPQSHIGGAAMFHAYDLTIRIVLLNIMLM